MAKALLDASLLPDVITGTSGGALVAALIATRTDSELQSLLVPALAYHINACEDTFLTWAPRWWRTGARFDSREHVFPIRTTSRAKGSGDLLHDSFLIREEIF